MKRSAIILFLGWAGIFLLPNHDLFNYILAGTPLTIWKQLLATIIFLIAISWALRSRTTGRADLTSKKILFAYVFAGMLFVTYSLALGLSPSRVIYGLLAYSGLSGYIYFALLAAKDNKRIKIYIAISLISAVSSAGLIFDYYTDIFRFLPRLDELTLDYLERHDLVKRAAFFFGASTIVFPFQAFGLLSVAFICARQAAAISFILYNGFAATTIFSMYLTGSRAGFYLILITYLVGYRVATQGASSVIRHLLILFFATSLLLSNFKVFDYEVFTAQADRYIYALSDQDEGNSHRYARWIEGLELMTTISPEWFFGHGLGTTIGKFDDGITTATHFESSVLQAFYEGGFGLIIYRYLAAIVAIAIYASRFRHRTRETTALAFLIALVTLSTVVAPTFGAFHTQLVFFLSSGLLISLSLQRRER